MAVPVYTHPDGLRHDPGVGHPESPGRLRAILDRLAADPRAELREAPVGSRDILGLVHPEDHILRLEAMSRLGGGMLSLDTVMNRDSWAAVLGATGAVRRRWTTPTRRVRTPLRRSARRATTRWPRARWASAW